ncbi:MAG TPA: selenocysteine-specific translation elongation factor [Thermoanaerobaculia bacterium]|nr:selenocysteine-specific translation elongation factor [Thermoanaerobaculia bacterium]
MTAADPRRVVVGTAGHIDHGKTSLVAALTGIDCDRWAEEKRRGITIDLGFAHLTEEVDGETLQVGFVDVPGHERFVHNALAGLGGIRMMMLVVSADEGVMPQTREHLDICSLLDIPAGLVVLTKADLVEEDLLELAELELAEALEGTPFQGAPILTASSTTGEGIAEVRSALIGIAAGAEHDAGRGALPARLPIDRAFQLKGLGLIATGTLERGSIGAGDGLEILPQGRTARVRSIQVHERERERAVAGERTSVQLVGTGLESVVRGEQAVEPGAFLAGQSLLARCHLLPSAPKPIRGFAPVRFHLLSSERIGKLRPLATPTFGPETLEPGGTALVEIRLDSPVVAVRGDRFIVRRPSPQTTLGGGTILDPDWRRPRREQLESQLRRLDDGDEQALLAWAERAGEAGVELPVLCQRLGVRAEDVDRRLRGLADDGALLVAPAGPGHAVRWIAPAAYRRITERAQRVLRSFFDRNRMSIGMPKAEAVAAILPKRAAELADVYLPWLSKQGVLAIDGDRVRLPGRGEQLTEAESSLAERIARAFEARGLVPPESGEIRAEVNAQAKVFEGLLRFLTERGRLVRLPSGLFISKAALERLRAELQAAGWESFTVGEFKDRFSLTRKWAIPLLEYLDAQGVTRRAADRRFLR